MSQLFVSGSVFRTDVFNLLFMCLKYCHNTMYSTVSVCKIIERLAGYFSVHSLLSYCAHFCVQMYNHACTIRPELEIPLSLESMPTGDELKWLLKEGGGHIFQNCDISLENLPTSHAVCLALVVCACSDSEMPLL